MHTLCVLYLLPSFKFQSMYIFIIKYIFFISKNIFYRQHVLTLTFCPVQQSLFLIRIFNLFTFNEINDIVKFKTHFFLIQPFLLSFFYLSVL